MTRNRAQEIKSDDNSPQLAVNFAPISNIDEILVRWRALEEKAQPSFFLSSIWIETWLRTQNPNAWLAQLSDPNGELIALGLFSVNTQTRHGVLPVRQLLLHATGDLARDKITIEYNGLLCRQDHQKSAWRALIEYLRKNNHPQWDEIVLTGIKGEQEHFLAPLASNAYRRSESGSHFVDLNELRAKGVKTLDDYLATLSKNTRSQIRRAFKLYAERGEICLDRATSVNEANNWFAELSILHDKKWSARGVLSGIHSPEYLKFHHALIATGIDRGQIDLLRIAVGDQPIGWLYNFCDGNAALFYCGGFSIDDDNRLKPGLIAQVMAVEHYLQRGLKCYDFMAGDDRYKTSLAQEGPEIVTLVLQRRRMALQLETIARNARAKLQNRSGKVQ